MNKPFWNWLLVILSSIGLILFLVYTEGLENITRMFGMMDYRWLAVALASTVLFWVVDAAVLSMILRYQSRSLSYGTCLRSSLIGMMFGLITPLQSGNIAAQVVVLRQQGLDSGDAVAVMLVKNIVMMLSSLVLMSSAVLLKGTALYDQAPGFFWIVMLGILLNLLFITAMVVAGVRENLVRSVVLAGVRFLAALHIIKHPEAATERISVTIGRLHANFMAVRAQTGMVLRGTILGLLGMLGTYQISYFLYRGFGLASADYPEVVAGQIFSMTIQSIVPLPGGIGVTDGGFYFILISLFTKTFINFALIFWRFFTFYLPIFAGMIALAGFKRKLKEQVA